MLTTLLITGYYALVITIGFYFGYKFADALSKNNREQK